MLIPRLHLRKKQLRFTSAAVYHLSGLPMGGVFSQQPFAMTPMTEGIQQMTDDRRTQFNPELLFGDVLQIMGLVKDYKPIRRQNPACSALLEHQIAEQQRMVGNDNIRCFQFSASPPIEAFPKSRTFSAAADAVFALDGLPQLR